MSKYNSDLARLKQAEYCKENGPHFAPESGNCWTCKRNIYEPWTRMRDINQGRELVTTGVTVKEATNRLITGCPHCHRSYCS